MNLKILLAYHKKDVLFKDEVLTPVHAGRAAALKTKTPDDENLKWLLENTIGDNTGKNISEKNPLYNEMTVPYWAWKNYKKLGNPDFIGLMHYRRHFVFKDTEKPYYECEDIGADYLKDINYSPENVKNILKTCDFVCAAPQYRDSMYRHYKRNHDIKDLDTVIEIIGEKFPDFETATENYLSGQKAYFCNMTIFSKNDFFRYCEFIFTVVEELEKRSNMQGKRLFVSEWLTGIFITKLLEEGKKGKFLATMVAEGEHTIPLVLASDNNYAFPLFVTLASAFKNAHKRTFYDVRLLLSGDFSDENYQNLETLKQLYPQHKIKVYNMANQYEDASITIKHISTSTYYRLKLPSLLSDVNKCVYLDVDLIVNKDLSELFRMNVDDKYIAGVKAPGYLYSYENCKKNMEELDLPNLDQYVNAGVLLMNLKNMRKDNLEDIFDELLKKNYTSQDQHILNKACFGKIRILPPIFNAMTKYNLFDENAYKSNIGLQIGYTIKEWNAARKNPTIIHYANQVKPWQDPNMVYADKWWEVALSLPFFASFYKTHLSKSFDIYKNIYDKYVVYSMARFDLRANKKGTDIEVLNKLDTDTKITKNPAWSLKDGLNIDIVETKKQVIDLEVQCIGDGELEIKLRGMNYNCKDKKLPIYVNYKKFTINGKNQLENNKLIWHDSPYKMLVAVKNGQIVKIHCEWEPINQNTVLGDTFSQKIVHTSPKTIVVEKPVSDKKLSDEIASLNKKVTELQNQLKLEESENEKIKKEALENCERILNMVKTCSVPKVAQNKNDDATVQKLKKEITRIKSSHRYRIGSVITFIPGSIRRWFKRGKK